jgi:hypothetical protein
MLLSVLDGPSGPVSIAFHGMSQEDGCTDQAHNRCNRLDHRKRSFAPHTREKTIAALHSQKDSIV